MTEFELQVLSEISLAVRANGFEKAWEGGRIDAWEIDDHFADFYPIRLHGNAAATIHRRTGVDQAVDRDDAVGLQEQDREQGLLARGADLNRHAVGQHFQRAKNPEFHEAVTFGLVRAGDGREPARRVAGSKPFTFDSGLTG